MESIVIHFFTYVDKNKILNINILLMCLLKKKKDNFVFLKLFTLIQIGQIYLD